MAKWMCVACGMISDEQVVHKLGKPVRCSSGQTFRTTCGPWSNVTHVYRAGQEGWREKALRYVDDSVKAGKSHRSVLIGLADLPLEGDE